MTRSVWRNLYRTAAAAALIAVVYFRRNCGTEMVTFRGFGIFNVPMEHPGTALGWFGLLQEKRYVGLVLFDLHDLVNYALLGLIFLALYVALQRTRPAAVTIGAVCGFLGIGTYLASNQTLAMLSLSEKYAAATSETQRATLLAAGEALLAIHDPGGIVQGTGITAALFLVLLGGLLFSIAMLSSDLFGRAAAVTGIVANGLALTSFTSLAFAPAPYALVLVAIPTVLSAPFRVIWYVLIALRLLRLGRREAGSSAGTPIASQELT